jgi:riboflavin synthase
MFTGLVEDVGTLARVERRSDAAVLTIEPAAIPIPELDLGESVAVDGVCLTVTERAGQRFTVLAGAETLRRTTLGELRVQSRVNLERALRVGDRLGGHMVSGHVDGVGTIHSRRDGGANLEIHVAPPRELLRYVIAKGSICIDGISLTVNSVDDYSFAVALIPHTTSATTLANKAVGSKVNLEVDLIGKYVEKLVAGYRPAGALP